MAIDANTFLEDGNLVEEWLENLPERSRGGKDGALSSAKHQDSIESAGLFVSYGPLEAHELMRAIGKILEEKLACRFESEALQLSQHKKELQTQVKPGKGHPSNYGAPPDLWQEEWVTPESNFLGLPELMDMLNMLQRPENAFRQTDVGSSF
ncbi:hypothetical protein MG293_007594 [Ovis ammon polii]|uniref:Uncharacterized protein n=2 Tax=Ovis TaxID=9935 RepID=A0AAD4Y8T0_OVIAM|nr:hypothetical protein MG293_007594 [Ovis ammon polii]